MKNVLLAILTLFLSSQIQAQITADGEEVNSPYVEIELTRKIGTSGFVASCNFNEENKRKKITNQDRKKIIFSGSGHLLNFMYENNYVYLESVNSYNVDNARIGLPPQQTFYIFRKKE